MENLSGKPTVVPVPVNVPTYCCGKCNSEFLRKNKDDTPRCPDCGYRVIFKSRTKKVISYLAR